MACSIFLPRIGAGGGDIAERADPFAPTNSSNLPQAGDFNRATQARRQPGSALKPFVYGLAFERRLLTPASLIDDSPTQIATSFDERSRTPVAPTSVTHEQAERRHQMSADHHPSHGSPCPFLLEHTHHRELL